MLGLGQPGLSLTFHRAIERAINLTCWGGSGAADVGTPKWGGRALERWNVGNRAGLPENFPSNEVERFQPSWLTRKRSIKRLERWNFCNRAGLLENVPSTERKPGDPGR